MLVGPTVISDATWRSSKFWLMQADIRQKIETVNLLKGAIAGLWIGAQSPGDCHVREMEGTFGQYCRPPLTREIATATWLS